MRDTGRVRTAMASVTTSILAAGLLVLPAVPARAEPAPALVHGGLVAVPMPLVHRTGPPPVPMPLVRPPEVPPVPIPHAVGNLMLTYPGPARWGRLVRPR